MTDGPRRRAVSIAGAPQRDPDLAVEVLRGRVEARGREWEAVSRLEERIAGLLGKTAAVMFPTGTMAQQVALRLHADRRGVRSVAFHPHCHLEVHEHKGYSVVHGLNAVLVGRRQALVELSDLDEVAEPLAALLLELPQRDLGGRLPAWDDLVAQTSWARERGVATHMDGARLWLAQPFYDRTYAEIAGLFDTVFVAFDKELMGSYGAVLAGDHDLIARATVWRNRLGGNVSRAWPFALLAERGLDEVMPRMAEFAERARKLAAAVADLEGVRVVPGVPQTSMLHLYLEAPADAVAATSEALLAERRVALPLYVEPAELSGTSVIEVSVSEQLDEVTDAEFGDLVAELLMRARST
ncbi:L-threonine aldolase [Herbihabitans rhizosphaerae]|uniref:L-threonine aldolase n=1 Tax=Herbihabitans rhizosphaerae TaxID=1872711 RepID=A0A4Q7KIE8_9PSEU|nr:beta-eliminating lyase-related protein [Herbihabitans rhizosphaerae]RZS34690.1 L-threonine aldolase [Herbihabitans rhizosphaerae]